MDSYLLNQKVDAEGRSTWMASTVGCSPNQTTQVSAFVPNLTMQDGAKIKELKEKYRVDIKVPSKDQQAGDMTQIQIGGAFFFVSRVQW